jgi:hypothetical protein
MPSHLAGIHAQSEPGANQHGSGRSRTYAQNISSGEQKKISPSKHRRDALGLRVSGRPCVSARPGPTSAAEFHVCQEYAGSLSRSVKVAFTPVPLAGHTCLQVGRCIEPLDSRDIIAGDDAHTRSPALSLRGSTNHACIDRHRQHQQTTRARKKRVRISSCANLRRDRWQS